MDYVKTRRNAENSAVDVVQKAAEIINLERYYSYHESEENFNKIENFHFFTENSPFFGDMDNNRN